MEIINILNDVDPEGLSVIIREFESHGEFSDHDGFVYIATCIDQESGEEIDAFRRVFKSYPAAFEFAKKSTNKS